MVLAAPGYLATRWMHLKMPLVALLVGYHAWCYRLMLTLREGRPAPSQRWLRLFNEVPALLLVAIVVLAVVKP
jgi:protoporphyrinogen IX oxidase